MDSSIVDLDDAVVDLLTSRTTSIFVVGRVAGYVVRRVVGYGVEKGVRYGIGRDALIQIRHKDYFCFS